MVDFWAGAGKIQNEPGASSGARKCLRNNGGMLNGHRNNVKELSIGKVGVI